MTLPHLTLSLLNTRQPSPHRLRDLCPLRAPTLSLSFIQLPSGTHRASWVLQRISFCMPRLRTPPDLHILTFCSSQITDASVLHSVRVKTLCVWIAPFEARYTFTTRDGPYGLQNSLCTLTSLFVIGYPIPSMRSTLDTGGWLDLSRQGLSPCKIR